MSIKVEVLDRNLNSLSTWNFDDENHNEAETFISEIKQEGYYVKVFYGDSHIPYLPGDDE